MQAQEGLRAGASSLGLAIWGKHRLLPGPGLAPLSIGSAAFRVVVEGSRWGGALLRVESGKASDKKRSGQLGRLIFEAVLDVRGIDADRNF